MDTTHYLDDDGDAMMDTKEEFVVCAFIGNAVESTSVDLVLRDYCEFAIETNGGSDDDDDSEVEAHLTGYYVPEYDEDEDAAANAYGDEGEEMYDEEDEDDEDFLWGLMTRTRTTRTFRRRLLQKKMTTRKRMKRKFLTRAKTKPEGKKLRRKAAW